MRAAAVLGKTKEVTRDDLQRLGEGQGVRMTDAVINEVLAAVRDWERWAGEAGLSRFRTGQVMDELPGVGG